MAFDCCIMYSLHCLILMLKISTIYQLCRCNFCHKDISGAMKLACEILTADPEGGAARIPFNLFEFIYKYLAEIDGEIPEEHINAVLECLEQQA